MKKRILPAILLLLLHQQAVAQEHGIRFDKDPSWENILQKARAENKHVFVDVMASYCGPCRDMEKRVFSQDTVGDFFNTHFISIKLQFDSTGKEEPYLQQRLPLARMFDKKYNIPSFPTYMYFNNNGELLHIVYSGDDVANFLQKASFALDPQKQYWPKVQQYNAGNREPSFLYALALDAAINGDRERAPGFTTDYLATKPDLSTKANMNVILLGTYSVADPGFPILLERQTAFEQVLGEEQVQDKIFRLVTNNLFSQLDTIEKWNELQWLELETSLNKKYPSVAREVLMQLQSFIYVNKKDWAAYAKTMHKYIEDPGTKIDNINAYTWAFVTSCTNKKILADAAAWMRKIIDAQNTKDPGYINTYCHLLYKMGRKKEALAWAKKARTIALQQGKDWDTDVIEKMEQGRTVTWE